MKVLARTSGKRYKITKVGNEIMKFVKREDKKTEVEWRLNLEKLYYAYLSSGNFSTIYFKPFVPRKHLPTRGLLIHWDLLN